MEEKQRLKQLMLEELGIMLDYLVIAKSSKKSKVLKNAIKINQRNWANRLIEDSNPSQKTE